MIVYYDGDVSRDICPKCLANLLEEVIPKLRKENTDGRE